MHAIVLVACSASLFSVVDILPDHGSYDVPLNTTVMIEGNWERAPVRLQELDSETNVPLKLEYRGDHYQVYRPTTLLRPNTGYLVKSRGSETRGWSRFTTGDRVDRRPPEFAGLEGMTLTFEHSATDSCMDKPWVTRASLEYSRPRGAAYTVFELQYDRIPFKGHEVSSDDDLTSVLVGQKYCGRVVAYDLAGNAAGANVERCAVAGESSVKTEPVVPKLHPIDAVFVEEPELELKPSGYGLPPATLAWKLLDALLLVGGLCVFSVRARRRRERERPSGRS